MVSPLFVIKAAHWGGWYYGAGAGRRKERNSRREAGGKSDFDYFFRNQPRYKAHPGKRGAGGRPCTPPQLFVKDLLNFAYGAPQNL